MDSTEPSMQEEAEQSAVQFGQEEDALETEDNDTDFGDIAAIVYNGNMESRKASAQAEADALDPPIFDELPQSFPAKYLGRRDAAGLWGIRYTRKPVDSMVKEAREMKVGDSLPFLKLTVSEHGVQVSEMPGNTKKVQTGIYAIHMISYGVQDLVYTRVFAMITVRETNNVRENHPFTCHAFVCDSRQTARRLTFALAAAFKIFSQTVKAQELKNRPKKFAIDLRPADEIQADYEENPVDDSEA